MNPKSEIRKDDKQKVFCITTGKYTSLLGYDVCNNQYLALCKELNINPTYDKGTLKQYNDYKRIVDIVSDMNSKTGFRSNSQLIPEFIGHEYKRVEVIRSNNEKARFIIGKSTGIIPIHLEIKTTRSTGGAAVYGYPFKKITFLNL
jgi:hypothetical protein